MSGFPPQCRYMLGQHFKIDYGYSFKILRIHLHYHLHISSDAQQRLHFKQRL